MVLVGLRRTPHGRMSYLAIVLLFCDISSLGGDMRSTGVIIV